MLKRIRKRFKETCNIEFWIRVLLIISAFYSCQQVFIYIYSLLEFPNKWQGLICSIFAYVIVQTIEVFYTIRVTKYGELYELD